MLNAIAVCLISVIATLHGSLADAQNVIPVCDGTPQRRTVRIPRGRSDSDERLEAKAQAALERQAVESCGSDVSGESYVEDSHLAFDVASMASRGVITRFDKVRFGIPEGRPSSDSGGTPSEYEMVAMVGVTRNPAPHDNDFRVTAWMEPKRPLLADGIDKATIHIHLAKTACIYIFNIAADHSISILYPTSLDQPGDNCNNALNFVYPTAAEVSAGRSLRFGLPDGIDSNCATESMHVLATSGPLDLSDSGIQEAINRPRSAKDTASFTALGLALVKAKVDVASSDYEYTLQRPGEICE